MCVQDLKSVALPEPELIGDTQKLGRSMAMPSAHTRGGRGGRDGTVRKSVGEFL